jgi:uncharacterized protein (TIGR00297 family)
MNLTHLFQVPPVGDWINLILLFGGILILIIISEFTRKKLHWRQEVTRKIVHISVGFLLLLTPLLLKTSFPLLLIAAFFTIFNFIALKKNLLPGIHLDRHNLGTVYYAFSFFILVLLFWQNHKVIIIASMMVMAVGDAAAAIIGRSIERPHIYCLIRDQKSWEGSLTMFVISTTAIFMTFILYPPNLATSSHSTFYLFLFSVLAAIIASVAEALGDRGNDNLSVPLVTAVVIYFLLSGGRTEHIQFITGMVLGGIVVLPSYRANFLTPSGSAAAFILACIIFGFGGWKWTTPILTFFIFSSMLSKLGRSKTDSIFEKGSRRDYAQVLANGGIAGTLMVAYILFPASIFYSAYLGSLAAATADTWSTEIGMRARQQPRLISNFQQVPAGTSGGITPAGIAGGAVGAFILAISGSFFFNSSILWILLIVTFTGIVGSLLDSLMGATVQIQFKCRICGNITEKRKHCGNNLTEIASGINWMNNDMVNFFNTLAGALISLLAFALFLY